MIADYVTPRACWRCLIAGDPSAETCYKCRNAHTETVKLISTEVSGGAKSIIEVNGEFKVVPTIMLRNVRKELESG